jgi:hypothetical protein
MSAGLHRLAELPDRQLHPRAVMTQPSQGSDSILDQDEADQFVLWAVEYAGDEGVTREELAKILEELAELKLSAGLWHGVNDRRFRFRLSEDGELVFSVGDGNQ